VDRAVMQTVGCDTGACLVSCAALTAADTLRLIASVSRLAATPLPTDVPGMQRAVTQTSQLHTSILSRLAVDPPTTEEQLASQAFNLAVNLYFLSEVRHSTLSSPFVRWSVAGLLQLVDRASKLGYRQAWATWPYFILGLHVTTPQDQDKVRSTYSWLEATLSIGNLSTLRVILEALWQRRARGEAVTWQE
jgi:hypothetical protein